MVESGEKGEKVSSSCWNLIGRSTTSCILVLLTQFGLSLVPRYFSTSPLLLQLPLSGLLLLLVLGFGRWCRHLGGVHTSAPAFVFFTILFIWGVFMFVIRQAISRFAVIVFNAEVAMLLVGICRIIRSNPGVVSYGSSESHKLIETNVLELKDLETSTGCTSHKLQNRTGVMAERVRYCNSCKAYVKGFDHHCPAFGNCIGKNNHVLFMVLLVGFLATEASYVVCSLQYAKGSLISSGANGFETNLARTLVIGTLLFSLLQVLWQAVFFAWHVYCVCFNIRTDEWINWNKYPEFQLRAQPPQGFRNPYDKGILQNVKEFLAAKGS